MGKTFSVRRFGHEHFEHFVEINFIENPHLVNVFSKATSSQDILLRLSTITKQSLVKGKTQVLPQFGVMVMTTWPRACINP